MYTQISAMLDNMYVYICKKCTLPIVLYSLGMCYTCAQVNTFILFKNELICTIKDICAILIHKHVYVLRLLQEMCFIQGWEFAHLISERIARFLSKTEWMIDSLKKMSDSLISLIFGERNVIPIMTYSRLKGISPNATEKINCFCCTVQFWYIV